MTMNTLNELEANAFFQSLSPKLMKQCKDGKRLFLKTRYDYMKETELDPVFMRGWYSFLPIMYIACR